MKRQKQTPQKLELKWSQLLREEARLESVGALIPEQINTPDSAPECCMVAIVDLVFSG